MLGSSGANGMEMTLIIALQLHDAMKVHHVCTEALTTAIKKRNLYSEKVQNYVYIFSFALNSKKELKK